MLSVSLYCFCFVCLGTQDEEKQKKNNTEKLAA
jgi:hypothetical protein